MACANDKSFGVNYGILGDNLPWVGDVIKLYQKNGIKKMRLFEPLQEVLYTLRGTGIEISLGVRNEDLTLLAADPDSAKQWVQNNILAYNGTDIAYVTVGNEIVPGAGMNLVDAMTNIHKALLDVGLSKIKVTTVIHLETLGVSYPPSQGAFTPTSSGLMKRVGAFLQATGFPIMVNVYPYFAYAAHPDVISLDYALCNPAAPPVMDGNLTYTCMVDAMVDAFYYALEKVGAPNLGLVISEIGWPNAGNGNMTTPELARTHNKNLLNHVLNNGTPKRPGYAPLTYFFAMFNENKKPAGIEQYWGFFYPNGTAVYDIFN